MEPSWLITLKKLVEKKPIVVLRFDEDEWERLYQSRRGVNEFTIARSHELLEGVRAQTPCLVRGKGEGGERLYFGLISSRSAVTTLESRIKIRRGVEIRPRSKTELMKLVTERPHAQNLRRRLSSMANVTPLSPKLSVHLTDRLASIEANRGAMRAVAESLSAPKLFRGAAALQEDAVRTVKWHARLTPLLG